MNGASHSPARFSFGTGSISRSAMRLFTTGSSSALSRASLSLVRMMPCVPFGHCLLIFPQVANQLAQIIRRQLFTPDQQDIGEGDETDLLEALDRIEAEIRIERGGAGVGT